MMVKYIVYCSFINSQVAYNFIFYDDERIIYVLWSAYNFNFYDGERIIYVL
jgi:hypothetical protein